MLKGFFKRSKGFSFGFRMNRLFWKIRYAFQRAYRGYDYTDICNLNVNFINRMTNILKDFNDKNVALWCKPNGTINDTYSEEETKAIIRKMIEHFEKADADGWMDFEDELTLEEISDFEKNAKYHLNQALKMFVKYFDQLWY